VNRKDQRDIVPLCDSAERARNRRHASAEILVPVAGDGDDLLALEPSCEPIKAAG
jgi:hypothetical protein